jgi:hypothetical protein
MPWSVDYEEPPNPGKGGKGRNKPGRATATYVEPDGSYEFVHPDKVDPDDPAAVAAFKQRALAALAADRAEQAARKAVNERLAGALNAEPAPAPPAA